MNPRYRAWTPEEEQRVRDGYWRDEPWQVIAEATGRSIPAVKVRASRLGLLSVDMGDVERAEDRWGVGKAAGGVYWTAERTEAALRAFVSESRGMLPGGYGEYHAVKCGRAELPTWQPIRRHVLSADRPTLSHVWLAYGAPRNRVKTLGGAWTEAEHDYLLSTAGKLRLLDIAKRLHRTYAACRRRLYDYGTSARNNQGYMSAQQVADEYGCDVKRVVRLIKRRILVARLLHGNRYEIDPRDAEAIADVLRAPAARGKGWRYVDGKAIPPRAQRRAEPEFITRVRPRGMAVAS